MYGLASTGKDVLLLLLTNFLGVEQEGYAVMLPGKYLVQQGSSSSHESATPLLARAQNKRAIWCSEVPAHEQLNAQFLKPFCEQGGAMITGRPLFKSPKDFRPTAVLTATSNHPPEHKQATEDDGLTRRAGVYQTTRKFVPRPQTLTELKADDRGHDVLR